MILDEIRDGDREQVLELQKKAKCEFPVPDPLTGFVLRGDDRKVYGWAGWEPVAEVLGVIDPDLSVREKLRAWSGLHKPVESQIVRKGITIAYVHLKREHERFAALLAFLGWSFCPGFWLRREAGKRLSQRE